jgi:hypothetical protein
LNPDPTYELFLVVNSASDLSTEILCLLCTNPIQIAYAKLNLESESPIYFDLGCFKMLIAVGAKYIYEQQNKNESLKN